MRGCVSCLRVVWRRLKGNPTIIMTIVIIICNYYYIINHHLLLSQNRTVQCESKSGSLKLFAIFSLRLSIFLWNFAKFVANLYPHTFANFGRFVSISNKMALIFPGVLIVFTVSSFVFHQVKLSWRHRQW